MNGKFRLMTTAVAAAALVGSSGAAFAHADPVSAAIPAARQQIPGLGAQDMPASGDHKGGGRDTPEPSETPDAPHLPYGHPGFHHGHYGHHSDHDHHSDGDHGRSGDHDRN